MPPSRPMPDCLKPPNGILMSTIMPLTVTLPERTRRANS